MRDINRTFETTGLAGGQRVFYYDADTAAHTLYLQSKIRTGDGRKRAGSRPAKPAPAGAPRAAAARRATPMATVATRVAAT